MIRVHGINSIQTKNRSSKHLYILTHARAGRPFERSLSNNKLDGFLRSTDSRNVYYKSLQKEDTRRSKKNKNS